MRIITLLGLIAGIFFASFIAQSIFGAAGISIDLMAASGVGQIVNYLIVLICAYLFATLVWRQSVTGYFLLYFKNWRKALGGFAVCAGLALGVGMLWYVFVFAAGGARWSSAAWAQTDAHELLKLLLPDLIAIILATTEEILFRALAFRYLLTSTTRWAVFRAMIVSSIIFALAHRFDDPLSWFELRFVGLLIGLTLLGCLLALVYYLTNSLACSIGAHTGLIWIALAKKTQVIQVASSGWDISNSFDPRTAPSAWLLFILLAVLFWSLRRWLRTSYAIENLDLAAGVRRRSLRSMAAHGPASPIA
jgi:membrane protease YdiL (CAAX protease family)